MLSAAAFIVVTIAIIGAFMACYYAMQCYPVIFERSRPRPLGGPPLDPERKNLITGEPDHNDNNEALALPNVPEEDDGSRGRRNECYPSAANLSESLDIQNSAMPGVTRNLEKKSLDVPDSPCNCKEQKQDSPKHEKMQRTPDLSVATIERRPLLHGDDEDGLILCQPSVRSKNTGEPIPPISHVPSKGAVNSSETIANKQKPLNGKEQAPSHMIINMPQALSVPPENKMSINHPPSHVIITVPQPLNHPPLMVAPVYDEPPMDDQPAVSLQQQLHHNVARSVAKTVERHVSEENETAAAPTYGWNDKMSPKPEKIKNVSVDHNIEIDSNGVEYDLVASKSPKGTDISETDSYAKHHEIIKIAMGEIPNGVNVSENSVYSSDNIPQGSPRSTDSTESSEAEISEYNFEADCRLPSTDIILADELSTVSNVKIIRYTSITESISLEAETSANDSTLVHVGDTAAKDGLSLDEQECSSAIRDQPGSPDLPISRRSPDGDSMKSLEGEPIKTPLNTLHSSSYKDDTHKIQNVTAEKIQN